MNFNKSYSSGILLLPTLLLTLYGLTGSYSAGLFKCPRQQLLQDFNISRFLGRWYEIERSFNVVELSVKCVSLDVSPNKRGQIQIISSNINKWSGTENIAIGLAIPGRRDPSIYQYKTSSILPNQLRPSVGSYQVIATDYINYAIIWSCSDYKLFYRDFVWIFARRKEIDVNTRAKLYDFLTKRHIDPDRLVISGSNDCS
ncbi:Lipocalin / cytosolic fatty-acid binding protein family [Popillia japonica]|uniref:Lipocalin / cytosolic fatty-acid binding protein family n=1 Tax=Popillia japonica TaxID=7064 RepID=A0AAW1IVT8_POPJA